MTFEWRDPFVLVLLLGIAFINSLELAMVPKVHVYCYCYLLYSVSDSVSVTAIITSVRPAETEFLGTGTCCCMITV